MIDRIGEIYSRCCDCPMIDTHALVTGRSRTLTAQLADWLSSCGRLQYGLPRRMASGSMEFMQLVYNAINEGS